MEPSPKDSAGDSSMASTSLCTEGLEELAPVMMIDDWIEPQGPALSAVACRRRPQSHVGGRGSWLSIEQPLNGLE